MLEIDFCLQCDEIPISCMLRRILQVASFVSFSFSWNRLDQPNLYLSLENVGCEIPACTVLQRTTCKKKM